MHFTGMYESIVFNVQTVPQPNLRSERNLHEAFVRNESELTTPAKK